VRTDLAASDIERLCLLRLATQEHTTQLKYHAFDTDTAVLDATRVSFYTRLPSHIADEFRELVCPQLMQKFPDAFSAVNSHEAKIRKVTS